MEFELLKLGLDIYDLDNGNLTLRRLNNIVQRLTSNPESEISLDLAEVKPEARIWRRQDTWLLANIQDIMSALDYHFVLANSEKGQGPKKPPEPVPRPTDKPKPRKRMGASLPVGPPPKK